MLTFESGLSSVGGCTKLPASVSSAEGRSTRKLDVHQSSSRGQPFALCVRRPTTASDGRVLTLPTQSSLQPRCNRQSQSRRSPGVRAEGQRAHFMPRTLRPVPGARDEILGNPCVERQDSKPSGTPGTAVKVSSTLCARKRSAMQGVPAHARARSAAHVGVRATSGPHRTTWPLRPRSTVCRQARWPQSDEQRAVL